MFSTSCLSFLWKVPSILLLLQIPRKLTISFNLPLYYTVFTSVYLQDDSLNLLDHVHSILLYFEYVQWIVHSLDVSLNLWILFHVVNRYVYTLLSYFTKESISPFIFTDLNLHHVYYLFLYFFIILFDFL